MDNNEDLNQVNEEETLYDEMNIPEQMPIENYNEDGAYQAKSNKEIQKERNIETNKKVSKMATEAAANYFGGPTAGKVVNKLNNTKLGDKLNESVGKKMHNITKRSFAGRNIQKTVNKLDDDGILDKGQAAMNALSGSGAGKGPVKPNANTNPNTNISNNKQKMNFTMNPKKSSIDMSKDKKNQLVRKKIFQFIIKHPWILGIILILFLLMIIMLVILGSGGAVSEDGNYGGIAFNGSCSEMPIYGTTLSRSEYIEKIHAYFNKNDQWESKIYDNAGNIYDIAKKNGINPELVVARAVLERGYSDYITNNYWGIGVYNGQPSGSVFASFSEGVLAFVNIVKQYSEAYEMMLSYAYIGTYWAADDSNTGVNCSTGYGGCYYLPHMKEYYDNESDYKKAESICSKTTCSLKKDSNGKCDVIDASKCVKTRSVGDDKTDQIAYAKYQVGKMAEKRKLIFGLDPIDCSSYIDEEGNVVNIENVNDIRELGQIIVNQAINTFDHYKYTLDIQLRDMPGYVDCASLVDRSYKLVGIDYLKHTIPGKSGTTWSEEQWCKENGVLFTNLDPSNLLPGDLLFTAHGSEGYPTHVALYTGNNKTFEATWAHSNSEEDVRVIQYGDLRSYFVSACRPLTVYFKNK